jgi:tricarballylate dehydrogenase
MTNTYDVVVAGTGNAALCAALAAREAGASVLVLEKAPEPQRGGNSFFTAGGFRFAHQGLEDLRRDILPDISEEEARAIVVPAYAENQFYDDLMRVTEGLSDIDMAEFLVQRSRPTILWMRGQGIRWILMFARQSYQVEGKHHFWGGLNVEAVGGGPGLVEMLLERAAKVGIDVRYEHGVRSLLTDSTGAVTGVVARSPKGIAEIPARAVILACGGFEANPEWRTRYLGPNWDLARVRGTRHNTGEGIRMALDIGAQAYGHWSSCHAVQWDLNAPAFGDRKVGDLFQKHSYPLGIMVNTLGLRFVDEGADFRNFTYVKYGQAVIREPQQTAFQIFDQKTVPILREEYRIREMTKAEAPTIEELARKLEIDPQALVRTVNDFNAAVEDKPFNPAILDGKGARGITPPKSNWAQKLDTPPYVGYSVTCGITFTFGGLRVDLRGQVLDIEDRPIRGLYAAGELVGGLFYHNYPGGTGLMAGSVYGKAAGESAAADIGAKAG